VETLRASEIETLVVGLARSAPRMAQLTCSVSSPGGARIARKDSR
jgi:hypothetical protein